MSLIFENTLNTRPILENSLKFIRSDVPTKVSEQEKQWLISNNVTTIVDLRTDEEREVKVCLLAKDKRFSYHCMPVTGGNPRHERLKSVNHTFSLLHKYHRYYIPRLLICQHPTCIFSTKATIPLYPDKKRTASAVLKKLFFCLFLLLFALRIQNGFV